MKKGVSAGGIVVKNTKGIPHVLLIKFPKYKTLAIPKGHVEKGESLEQAAVREVQEETGLGSLRIVKKLGIVKRLSAEGDEMKTIHIYLMETENYNHGESDEEYGWFTFGKAINKMAFPEEAEFLKKVRNKLRLNCYQQNNQ